MSLLGSFLKLKSKHKKKKKKKNKNKKNRTDPIAYLNSIFEGPSPFDPWSLSISEFEKIIVSFREIFKYWIFFNPNNPFSIEQAIHSSWLYMVFFLYCDYYERLNDFPLDKLQKVINLEKEGTYYLANVIRCLNDLPIWQFRVSSSHYRPYQQLLQINTCLPYYWHIISKNISELSLAYVLFPLQLNEDKLAVCRKFANARHGERIPTNQINQLKTHLAKFLEKKFTLYPSFFKPSQTFANRFHLDLMSGITKGFPLSIANGFIDISGDSHYLSRRRYTVKRVLKEIIFENSLPIFIDSDSWTTSAILILRTLQFPHVYAFVLEFEKLINLRMFVRKKRVHAQRMLDSDINSFCKQYNKCISQIMNSPNEMEYFTNNPHLLAFHELSQLDKEIQICVEKKYLQILLAPGALRSHPFFNDLYAEIMNDEIMYQIWTENVQFALVQSLPQKTKEYQKSSLPVKKKQQEFLERVLPISTIQNCNILCRKHLLAMAQSYPELCDIEYGNVISELWACSNVEQASAEPFFESKMGSSSSFSDPDPDEESLVESVVHEWRSFTPQKNITDLARLPHHLHLQPETCPIKRINKLMERVHISDPRPMLNFLKKRGQGNT